MKHFSFALLVFFFSGSLCSQTSMNTDLPNLGNWSMTPNIGCNPVPLTPGQIAGLNFSATPTIVCTGTIPATGNSKLGIGTAALCNMPNNETHVFRTTHDFATQPCLVTYNFTADNDFRIYVNGNNSPTNILPGNPPPPLPANGVCGNNYSGNDWRSAFPGTLNIAHFGLGNNNIDFETQNGTSTSPHPYWLSGSLLFWQFSDLDASLNTNFLYNATSNRVDLNYAFTTQTNGALYSILIESSNAYPTNPVWTTFFSKTGTPKQFKTSPHSFQIPTICDENGAAIRITFTAMAGACQTTAVYLWSCSEEFGAGVLEKVVKSISNTDNPNFVLTDEQIIDLHEQFNEKLTAERNLNLSLDSLFAASEGQSKLQVFPNPSNGHIWINTTEREDGPTPIKIFNQIGALVFEDRIQGRQEIDLSELPNGLYFLKSFEEKSGAINSTQFILQR